MFDDDGCTTPMSDADIIVVSLFVFVAAARIAASIPPLGEERGGEEEEGETDKTEAEAEAEEAAIGEEMTRGE